MKKPLMAEALERDQDPGDIDRPYQSTCTVTSTWSFVAPVFVPLKNEVDIRDSFISILEITKIAQGDRS